jgi:hypothetical protein
VPEDATVKTEPSKAEVTQMDRTVDTVARPNGGRYSFDLHLCHDPSASQAFATNHVRRSDDPTARPREMSLLSRVFLEMLFGCMMIATIKLDDQPGILQDEVDAIARVLFRVSELMLALDQVSQVAKLR